MIYQLSLIRLYYSTNVLDCKEGNVVGDGGLNLWGKIILKMSFFIALLSKRC
jgi:hypothetical protein